MLALVFHILGVKIICGLKTITDLACYITSVLMKYASISQTNHINQWSPIFLAWWTGRGGSRRVGGREDDFACVHMPTSAAWFQIGRRLALGCGPGVGDPWHKPQFKKIKIKKNYDLEQACQTCNIMWASSLTYLT